MPTLAPPRTGESALAPIRRLAPPSTDDAITRRLRWAGRVLAVLLCGLHAYVTRHVINPDGISYLDVASAYARGQWSEALNTYWGPLYSWLLAGPLALVGPASYWECGVAHVVSLATFVLALAAFEWLLTELLRLHEAERNDARERWHDLLPAWLVVGVGYALFAYVSRRLVTVSMLTPDMLVVAAVCAAVALLLRLRRTAMEAPGRGAAVALGAVLGAAYLAKAVMFPLGLVFLALVPITARWRRGLTRLGWATLAFAVLAGPWVAVLSWSRGRPTFGDSGRLNYLWHVNGVPHPDRLGQRRLLDSPLVVACGAPGQGSYPLWYDPSRYYEGVRPRLDLGAQLRASASVLGSYHTLFAEKLLAFSLAVGLLTGFSFFSRRGGAWGWLVGWLGALGRMYPLLAPAVAGLGLYVLVGHAEGRLVGAFVLLLALALLLAVRVPHPRQATVRPVGTALLAVLFFLLGSVLAHDTANAAGALVRGETGEGHPHWQIARRLAQVGLRPGDDVASVGFTYNAYWARLGGHRVVAEVPAPAARVFWASRLAERESALTACGLAGARAVVADRPPGPLPSGWTEVPGTAYIVRRLDPRTQP